METPNIREDEVLEKLGLAEYYILQKKEGYRFTIDPILLAGFTETGYHDKILDLGTGGDSPFLLQKNNREKELLIIGIDIQREYIDIALRSKKINKTENINFLEIDIKRIPANFRNPFDVVVTNSPFFKVNEGKINHKKDIALSCHELEVDFSQIIKAAT